MRRRIGEDTLAKARVLLVEDDPVQAEVTQEILGRVGYEVMLARDGISAIKTVKSSKPDIILLDLMIPGLDGYEVCRWLKLEESTRGIPVIMLTARKELADKISGLQIGADDYLPKPYNELELNARIYASLRTKSLQDELRSKNKQLEELLSRVEHMAITDALTGLFNRRRFNDVLAREFDRSKRYSVPFALMLMDIDHFKKINDTFGHQTGDAILKELALVLMRNIREIDTPARFGGEEFTIVLPSTDRNAAMNLGDRLRGMIEGHQFPDCGDTKVTVSIGISGMPDEGIESQDSLIRCADLALYRAKQNGRNRVEVIEGKELDFLRDR